MQTLKENILIKKTAFIYDVLLMVMLLVGIASGTCSAATESSGIRVGSEREFAPYAFIDENGQPAGFSVDLIRAVADAMGLSLNISADTWDSVWNDLAEGRLDVLPLVAKMPERTKLVDFSLPHTTTYDAFFVRQGDPIIQNIKGAIGKEIVVMRSDAAHHALLERNFQGRLILVDTIPEGLSLISSGKHDAFLCSKLIGVFAIERHKIKSIAAGPAIPGYKRVFSFAVKKGDTELLEKLNQGLLIVKASGKYQQIYNKWLRIDDPWQTFEKYLMHIILVVTVVFLIGSFWLFMLKRQVSKRTSDLRAVNEELENEIRDRKLAEAEAIRTSQLASVGELAAGVAHEINNPINGIINYSQILSNNSVKGSKEKDIASRIIKEGDRISKIVANLLGFARTTDKIKGSVSISEILSETLSLTGAQMKKDGIKLVVDIQTDLPGIIAHRQQIEQVFLNIISNARYVLNQKYPGTHNHKCLEILGQTVTIDNNPYIRIVFYDHGSGIPENIKDKIMNPFFTTKPTGHGTGLGLSISHGIIKDHSGKLTFDSVEGEYTKVILDLPQNS